MGRRHNELESIFSHRLILPLVCFASCGLVYALLSAVLTNSGSRVSEFGGVVEDAVALQNDEGCCRGIENLELWGAAVKWGSEFKFNNSEACCNACKAMCSGNDGPCLCDTWVFCGDRKVCGSKFGEVSDFVCYFSFWWFSSCLCSKISHLGWSFWIHSWYLSFRVDLEFKYCLDKLIRKHL